LGFFIFMSQSASFMCYFSPGIVWFWIGGIHVLYQGRWASWLLDQMLQCGVLCPYL
jgi:hypothetical protein